MSSHPTAKTMSAPEVPTRLARKLGLGDAVGIGLGAMLGAGAFAAPGPAAALAGSGIVLALVLAGLVAYANATSTARLSAAQPQAGGVYAFGRKRLNDTAGFMAGWAFLAGKLASLTAMALTFGAYAFPDHAKVAGVTAVVVMTAVNLSGVQRTAKVATLGGMIVGLGILTIGLMEIVAPGDGSSRGATFSHLTPVTGTGGLHGILGAAGIMFFAFAGYARIATLGEEVKDPANTIPKAVPLALGAAFVVYLVSVLGALVAVGPEALAQSEAPLETAARAVIGNHTAGSVSLIAVIAVLGVLLSLLAGVSRTAFAMADDHELPKFLSGVSKRTKVPHIAQLATCAIVVVAVLLVPTAKAIATSSLLILTYYGIAHLSALKLSSAEQRPKLIAPLGLLGCAVLALNLPVSDVATGVVILAVGLITRAAVRTLRRS